MSEPTPAETPQREGPATVGGMPVPSLEEIEDDKINTDLALTSENPTRAQAAVALKLSGASYPQIAQVMEYASAYDARAAVERALAMSADTDDLGELRVLTSRRLERLLQTVWRRAANDRDPDHLAYVRAALAIVDRHSRLHGLDSPQQMVVHTPSTLEVQRWVQTMVAQVRGEDIVEAEVIEEGEHGEPAA